MINMSWQWINSLLSQRVRKSGSRSLASLVLRQWRDDYGRASLDDASWSIMLDLWIAADTIHCICAEVLGQGSNLNNSQRMDTIERLLEKGLITNCSKIDKQTGYCLSDKGDEMMKKALLLGAE